MSGRNVPKLPGVRLTISFDPEIVRKWHCILPIENFMLRYALHLASSGIGMSQADVYKLIGFKVEKFYGEKIVVSDRVGDS